MGKKLPYDLAHDRAAGITVANSLDTLRGLRADYDMAGESQFIRKRKGLPAAGAGGDWHFRSESKWIRMIERARDLDRNDEIIGQGVSRLWDNVLTNGFAPDPYTGDDALDKEFKERFNEWAGDSDQCDITGEHDLHGMVWHGGRDATVDGDAELLPLESGHLQSLEAHRMRTPANTTKPVRLGVLLGDQRQPLEYWVTKTDLDGFTPLSKVSDIIPYKARTAPDLALGLPNGISQFFMLKMARRRSMTRGVSAFAPIFNTSSMLGDIGFATMVRHQVASCFAIIEETTANAPVTLGNKPDAIGSQRQETRSDGTEESIGEIKPGMHLRPKAGRSYKMDSPKVPAPEFFDHSMFMMTLIAANLGVPVATLLLDPQSFSWSSARWVTEEARRGFKRLRRLVASSYYTPIWRWQVMRWMEESPGLRKRALELRAKGGNIFNNQWVLPRDPYLEPVKDATARLLRERTGQSSPRRLYLEDGLDIHEITEETIDDNAMRIMAAFKKAQAMNAAEKELKVHWRELLSMPMPDGISLALSGDSPTPNDAPTRGGKAA